MRFSDFVSNKRILSESVNLGSSMESVFSIMVGLQIAYGRVEPTEVRKLRNDLASKNGKEITIQVDVKDNPILSNLQADDFDKLTVKVKSKPNKESKHNSIVDGTIETLSQRVSSLKAVDTINRYMVKLLTNKRPDEVVFYVIDEGGERMSIQAKSNTPVPVDLELPITFTTKINEPHTVKMGIFRGILKLGQMFNLQFVSGLDSLDEFPENYSEARDLIFKHQDKWDDDSHIIHYIKEYIHTQDKFSMTSTEEFQGGERERNIAQAAKELEIQKQLVEVFLDHFQYEVEGKDTEQYTTDPRNIYFSSLIFKFLDEVLFKDTVDDVITVSQTDIKESSRSSIEELKNKYVVDFQRVGNTMKFFGIDINNNSQLLFEIKPRLEYYPYRRKIQLLSVEVNDLN